MMIRNRIFMMRVGASLGRIIPESTIIAAARVVLYSLCFNASEAKLAR